MTSRSRKKIKADDSPKRLFRFSVFTNQAAVPVIYLKYFSLKSTPGTGKVGVL